MDLRSWDKNTEEIAIDKKKRKKKTVLDDEQIKKAKLIYNSWQLEDGSYKDIPELCKSVDLEEIVNKNYNLAPSNYIDFINHDKDIDIDKSMSEIMKNIDISLREEQKTVSLLKQAIEEFY